MEPGAATGSTARHSATGFGKPAGRVHSSSSFAASTTTAMTDVAAGSDPCPEIGCVRHLLPAALLAGAQERAATVGVSADRVLITAGAIDEDTYLRALGAQLSVDFTPLDDLPREHCPLDNERLIEAARTGLLPVSENGDLKLVVAPRGTAARRLLQLIESNATLASRFRLTSADRFRRFVLRHAGNLEHYLRQLKASGALPAPVQEPAPCVPHNVCMPTASRASGQKAEPADVRLELARKAN